MGWVWKNGGMYYQDDPQPTPPWGAGAHPPVAPWPGGSGAGGSGTGTGTATYGQQSTGGAGTPFYTGSVGTKDTGKQVGPTLAGFNNTGIDFEAIKKALADQAAKVDGIFGGQLGVGTGQFGQLGSVLSGMMGNPTGFNPADMQKARTRIAEREAGIRTGQLSRLNASKFGPRVADFSLRESLRGQSGQRITDQELALDMADQQMKQQNWMAAIQAALGTAGISAGLTGQHAQIVGNSNSAFAAGEGGGQSGPGSSQLPNERGLPQNRLPGESLADQIRREAAAWQAYYGGASTPTG